MNGDFKKKLEGMILAEHSSLQAQLIAEEVGPDAERFAVLWQLMVKGKPPIPQRASYTLFKLLDRHMFLLEPYLIDSLALLDDSRHVAVRRNLIRAIGLLPQLPDDEEWLGTLANRCFHYLESQEEPVAVRVFAMQVLANIAEREPGLAGELILLIESQMPYGSAGYKSRGRKILKRLKRLV